MPATPVRSAEDQAAVLRLIRAEFAYMDGLVDPPSSAHLLGAAEIARQAADDGIWAIGTPPVACVFVTVKGDALYIGKLAVDRAHRGRGHARALLDKAQALARARGLCWLELQTRVELTANQATFRHLGFGETGRTAHAGFDRPTSITYRRAVAP